MFERLRNRARLSAEVSAAIGAELKHFDGKDLAGLEQRVKDRLSRRYGSDTPTWQLILELILRLLPLLLQKPLDEAPALSSACEPERAAPPAPETVVEEVEAVDANEPRKRKRSYLNG